MTRVCSMHPPNRISSLLYHQAHRTSKSNCRSAASSTASCSAPAVAEACGGAAATAAAAGIAACLPRVAGAFAVSFLDCRN